ncbi:hypothetical protein PsorP6_015256 [Peronosclerospora sorghi]|uniref:Uncharacterized protein n=1 Tax=Peronosclerospora sorghi TaxID=230839 RepID=A0ACC0VTN6_9STRA|nr:hypothetical protein PsorP6_015256 [Peronosclerospora sorghi]
MLHYRDKKKDSVTDGGSSVADDVIPSKADDGIKVYRSGVESVVGQIETALLQLLNLTSRQMQNLLNRAGFEAMSCNSPFIRNFSTLKDLAKEFVKYMPRTYKYPNEAEDEVASPTSDVPKSSPSSMDSIRQVVDVAQGILTGSPKEGEAVVFPPVQSRPTEGASEDIVSDISRGVLARLLGDRSQIRSPSTLFVQDAEALGGQKVFAGSGSTLALQKAKSLQGRWYDKGNISVDGDNSSRDTQSPYQLRRGVMFVYGSDRYVVCALFGKTYGKWRLVTEVDTVKEIVVFATGVEEEQGFVTSNSGGVTVNTDIRRRRGGEWTDHISLTADPITFFIGEIGYHGSTCSNNPLL